MLLAALGYLSASEANAQSQQNPSAASQRAVLILTTNMPGSATMTQTVIGEYPSRSECITIMGRASEAQSRKGPNDTAQFFFLCVENGKY